MLDVLDEDWLKSLRFELPDDFMETRRNLKVTGLAGVGSTAIVFNIEDENGEKLAAKIYHELGFFLKEIPPGFIKGGECNINRINQKLYYLIGNPLVDDMCFQYKRLYAYIFSSIYGAYQTHKDEKLTNMTDEHFAICSFMYRHKLNEESSFILKTPGIKRKLNDLMSLSLNPINLSKEQSDLISRMISSFVLKSPSVKHQLNDLILSSTLSEEQSDLISQMLHNLEQPMSLQDTLSVGEVLGQALRSKSLWFNFPFEICVDKKEIIPWAESILSSIEELVPNLPYLKPESIINNPLYIWGAAVMDGLITEEAMPIAISFIQEKFGNLTKHPEMENWISQLAWFANLYVQCLDKGQDNEIYRIKKFLRFCVHAGYVFPIYDKNDNMISL